MSDFTLTTPQAIALAKFAGIEYEDSWYCPKCGEEPGRVSFDETCDNHYGGERCGSHVIWKSALDYILSPEGALKVLAAMDRKADYYISLSPIAHGKKWKVHFDIGSDSEQLGGIGDTAPQAIITAALTLDEVSALVEEEEEKAL